MIAKNITEDLVHKEGVLGVALSFCFFLFFSLDRWQSSKDTAFKIFVFWSVEFRVS